MWNVDVLEFFFFLFSSSRNADEILIIVVEIASIPVSLYIIQLWNAFSTLSFNGINKIILALSYVILPIRQKGNCSVLIISLIPMDMILLPSLTHTHTHTNTAWCTAPSEQPIEAHALKFPAFYGAASFVIMLTKAHVMYCLIVP
jgi:hypothetical protein